MEKIDFLLKIHLKGKIADKASLARFITFTNMDVAALQSVMLNRSSPSNRKELRRDMAN